MFDGQMAEISSVCGRHLGTPKSRVLNFLAEEYLIYLVSVTAVLFYLFLMSAFSKKKHWGRIRPEVRPQCCGFVGLLQILGSSAVFFAFLRLWAMLPDLVSPACARAVLP